MGGIGGLSPPQTKLQAPQIEIETLQISGIFVNF